MDHKRTLTETLIILAVSIHFTTGSSHSLKYTHTGETQGTNLKKYTVVGLVDEEEFMTYDINTKTMVLKTEWIKKNEGTDYLKSETQTMRDHEYWFRHNTDTLMECFSQTDGVNKWQWIYGCEMDEDGSTKGHIHYRCNGDFITLYLNKGTWTEANSDALTCFTKLKTDAYQYLIGHQKHYVENKCIDSLKQYIDYGGGSLTRKGCDQRSKRGTDEKSNCEHDSHSLHYFLTEVSQVKDFPEFTAVGLVDERQFVYYDSNIRKMIPKTEWMKKVDDDDPDYWNTHTQNLQGDQENFKVSVANVMGYFNHTEGVHTVQMMVGCELHDDETKIGYWQYGYDGEDFISLDLNTLTWTAANAKAVITKNKWEVTGAAAAQNKNYLENICIEWLQKYVDYGRDTLKRKDPPEVTLFQKDSSSPVVCHATGFFPRGVMISWQKNGEDLHKNVELRETLPNQDGTFQKRSILTVSPEELDKNEYTCVVQHSGLEKDLVLRGADRKVLNTGGGSVGVIIGAVMAVLLLVLIGCVGFFIWRKKNEKTSDFKPVARSDGESSSTSSNEG